MRTLIPRCVLAGVVLAVLAGAGVARAATAEPVTVRVEGTNATLVPPTLGATGAGPYRPIGKSSACPGTSALEPFDLAVAANHTTWDGAFSNSLSSYFVTTIAGEAHGVSPSDGTYWAFWHNHAPASLGVCGEMLNPGDEILFFPDCFAGCAAGASAPNVLGMSAPPAVLQKGTSATVTVTSYANADGAPSPAAGATVAGGGVSATAGSTGAATLTFTTTGTFTVGASAFHSVRSEPHTVCVHDGNDGNCGTPNQTGPPGPPSTTPPTPATTTACVHHGNDGLCNTPDQTSPKGHLSIAEGTRLRHGHGPRSITGRVDADPSGIRDVRLRLTRVVTHGRCEAFDPTRRRWSAARCGIDNAPSFSVGSGLTFSYLLPAPLTKGRYTVEVEAIDRAGNHDAPAPARNRIVFRVE